MFLYSLLMLNAILGKSEFNLIFFSLWLNFLCFTLQRPLPLNPVTGLGYVSYGDCADQVTLVSSVNMQPISRFKSHFILENVLNYILKYLLHCIVLVSLMIPILHMLAFCWLLALTIIFSLILLKSSSLFHSFAVHISIFCFPEAKLPCSPPQGF